MRQGRSPSPQTAQPETTEGSRRRAAPDTRNTRGRLAPSRIGIQKVREELEQAKNNNKISVADVSEYMAFYDEWEAAKGNTAAKDEKLKGYVQLTNEQCIRRILCIHVCIILLSYIHTHLHTAQSVENTRFRSKLADFEPN